jgi:hypothetical protein
VFWGALNKCAIRVDCQGVLSLLSGDGPQVGGPVTRSMKLAGVMLEEVMAWKDPSEPHS